MTVQRLMMLDNDSGYELLFDSLAHQGRGFAFPCDAAGRVDMDTLSARARDNYFYVRAVVGRDFAAPSIRPRPAGRPGEPPARGGSRIESIGKEQA